MAAAISNLIDPPPRRTGDSAHDTIAVIQWLNAFYTKGILSGNILQPQNLAPALISLGELTSAADMLAYYTAEDTFDLTGFTAWARTLLEAADAAAGRVSLGLGALAVNDTIDLATEVTGNLAVSHLNGGTGAAAGKYWQGDGTWGTPAGAGDVVGPAGATDGNVVLFNTATGKLIKDGGTLGSAAFTSSAAYQPADADLTTWAGITPGTGVATALAVNVGTAGSVLVNGGALGTPSSGTLTNASGLPAAGVTGTALVAAAIGTTVQAYDADLVTWAGITPGANVGTALGVAVGTDGAFVVKGGALGTPSGGTLTNCTGLPAAGVTGTALVAAAIGTTVQAYDADLTTWASITPGANVGTALAVAVGTDGAFVVKGGDLGSPSAVGTMPAFTLGGTVTFSATQGLITFSAVGSYNDTSGHNIGSFNHKAGIVQIQDEGGIAHVPFYANGGSGVGYNWTVLDPDTGWLVNQAGFSFSFTIVGGGTYTLAGANGSGVFTITRSAATAYTVYVKTF